VIVVTTDGVTHTFEGNEPGAMDALYADLAEAIDKGRPIIVHTGNGLTRFEPDQIRSVE
jgi:hypothetical protein